MGGSANSSAEPHLTEQEADAGSLVVGPDVGAVAAHYGLAALSPLERQVVALKASAPGCVLLAEVGYKYCAWGEDAQVLAAVLHVCAFPKQHMLVAGFPTQRLPVHLRRLLCAGHRVAVATQAERAAEKAAGESPHSTFQRRVEAVHTYATYVPPPDEADLAATESAGGGGGSTGGGPACCLLAIDEVKMAGGGAGGGGGVRLSLLAVDARAGAVFTEELEEAGERRAALRARLEALQPIELLLPPVLSGASLAALDEHVQLYRLHPQPPGACAAVRVERLDAADCTADAALAALTTPLPVGAGALGDGGGGADARDGGGAGGASAGGGALPLTRAPPLAPAAVAAFMALPAGLQRCLGAACVPLGRSALLPLLGDPARYRPLAEGAARMLLGAAALRDLHVMGPSGHCLLGLLDRTATPPGARQMQRWLAAPLVRARRRTSNPRPPHAAHLGAQGKAACCARPRSSPALTPPLRRSRLCRLKTLPPARRPSRS